MKMFAGSYRIINLMAVNLLLLCRPNNVHSSTSIFSNNVNNTLNCFGISNHLFSNVVESMFTQKTRAEDVKFYFYSREKSGKTTVRSKEKFNLKDLPLNVNKTTMILVHGFMSSGKTGWIKKMKDALLQMDDLNVIIVDWQKGSNTWDYISASISTKIVGTEIANLLGEIKRQAMKLWPEQKSFGPLYFVGHSLGAHICGHASYMIRNHGSDEGKNWFVYRITGLDPAQPCFTDAPLSLKLDKSDASFVDVIHTNAKGFGLPGQVGHVDFYPNGGQVQIGCGNEDESSFWSFIALPVDILKEAICSHGRSHELFTDSIKVKLSEKCTYVGHRWNRSYGKKYLTKLMEDQCDGVCPELGINAINYRSNRNESFFVPTGDAAPYCVVTPRTKEGIIERLRDGGILTGVEDFIEKIL